MSSTSSKQDAARPARGDSLEVHLLGLVDFESALFLQKRLVYDISGRSDAQAGLLICEHPPLITIGREGSRAQLEADPRDLAARLIDVRWINRGGDAIVHGPGQLAVYPIMPLDRLGLGVAAYRQRLEQAVIDMAAELHVPAHRETGQSGVWCRLGKFAHVGVAVKSWVAYHGLFVNVAPSMDLMRLARPLDPETRLTSLAAQRMTQTSMHAVRESLVRNLAAQLGYERWHVYTGHPLLRRRPRQCRYRFCHRR